MLWLWRQVTGDPGTRSYALPTAVFVVVALVIAIAHVYETVFLLKEWENDRLRSARTDQARLQTELESLGREVDPHFLFNSLNSLAYLVEQLDARAVPFIFALAGTYRYVLECRGRPLVPLARELDSLARHRTLAELRYEGQIHVDVAIDADAAGAWWLPPVTLSELFQNALKHNAASAECPFRIRLTIDDGTLTFENDLRVRPSSGPSTGVGLSNMAERFRIAAGRPVTWRAERERFVVSLPLVRGRLHRL